MLGKKKKKKKKLAEKKLARERQEMDARLRAAPDDAALLEMDDEEVCVCASVARFLFLTLRLSFVYLSACPPACLSVCLVRTRGGCRSTRSNRRAAAH